jgi:hypothetical protein
VSCSCICDTIDRRSCYAPLALLLLNTVRTGTLCFALTLCLPVQYRYLLFCSVNLMIVNGVRVLEDGLCLLGFHLARQNRNCMETKRRWFRSSFGVGPVALAKIFKELSNLRYFLSWPPIYESPRWQDFLTRTKECYGVLFDVYGMYGR